MLKSGCTEAVLPHRKGRVIMVSFQGGKSSMVNKPVLVLNQNYLPMNICSGRRALVLMLQGKAEMVENGTGEVHTVNAVFDLPSVIRLLYLIKLPRIQRKLSRFEIFNRDRFTCQYCGRETRELTLDHVVPRSRGGQHSWENLVSACIPCNHRKGERLPAEAKLKLIRQPKAPPPFFLVPYYYLRNQPIWLKFLPF
jgi:5-methylcytosine-specific restriction endonuclease McrA